MTTFFRNPISETFALLWKSIIRPPRDEYSLSDLGPTEWTLNGRYCFHREDLQLKTSRGVNLHCSHWLPISGVYKEGCQPQKLPCVVYLHTSMGSRREAYEEALLVALLVRGISVFVFDQSGSGMSDGEYISVGHFEELDLKAVLEYLRKLGTVGDIGLWGRSMGAITAVNRLRRDLQIKVAVLDSVLTNLKTVGEEIVASGEHIQIPNGIWSRLYTHICHEIKEHAGFDASEVEPIKFASNIDCPALFATAEGDTVVLAHHTQDMFRVWGAEDEDKKIFTFSGDHWDLRPVWFCEEAADFVERYLILRNIKFLEEMRKLADDRIRAEKKAEADAKVEAEAEACARAEMQKEKQQMPEATHNGDAKAKSKAKAKAKAKTKPKARPKAKAGSNELKATSSQKTEGKPTAKPDVQAEEMNVANANAHNCKVDAESLEELTEKPMPKHEIEEETKTPGATAGSQKSDLKQFAEVDFKAETEPQAELGDNMANAEADNNTVTKTMSEEVTGKSSAEVVEGEISVADTKLLGTKVNPDVIEIPEFDEEATEAKTSMVKAIKAAKVGGRAESLLSLCCNATTVDLADAAGEASMSYEHEAAGILHI